ncbi:imidazolonepropionase [Robertkochia aurantiaca]|uniref:imidazolonepropionase n=1 Tax=Robertkochia aurantiaca TaxID=2873700 RepID=UPI001CCC6261|nr:imidazolonepropionase [Robertkochia sp. 3YJGBD-33]
MSTVLINIRELLQIRSKMERPLRGNEMSILPSLTEAYLRIDNGRISDFGEMRYYQPHENEEVIDLQGKTVLPAWCDSHTHLVFAGNREQEFVDRINGLSYEEIASRGGGILNSAQTLRETSEEELYLQSAKRLEQVIAMGTGAIEIKSGYGLTREAELKMLRVIARLNKNYPVTVKATFLGAHAIPSEFKNDADGYITYMIEEVLPEVGAENLASFIDIFCEKGYFTVEQMNRFLEAGAKYDLRPKVHVNQFNAFGAVPAAVEQHALSVDHLEVLEEEDLQALSRSETIATALPLCSLFLSIPYTPARKIIKANIPLALATDFNPGSSPSGNMNQVVSLACIKMNMTPEEAINAATLNAAFAMGVENEAGSITIGKKANLIITEEIPSYAFLPYDFGHLNIAEVWLEGKPAARKADVIFQP